MSLVQIDFSEPYNIYTYRYFIHNWPQLCFLAREKGTEVIVGAIVCKLDQHKKIIRRGYIAMLAVDQRLRKRGIGKELVRWPEKKNRKKNIFIHHWGLTLTEHTKKIFFLYPPGRRAIEAMDEQGCDEVVLETEITNLPALRLYERLGFVRDERLFQYYLNGVDAFRLKLWLR